jgi:hypothetical protein
MMICENCEKQITERDDANILAFFGVFPKTFCNKCYSSKERGFTRHLLYFPKHPINSIIYIISLIFITILIIVYSFFVFRDGLTFHPFLVIFYLVIIWQWLLYIYTNMKLSELD